MTLYLTDDTPPEEIAAAARSGFVVGVKLYPAGATTNSAAGVTDVERTYPALEAMAECRMPLLVHGEVTDPETVPVPTPSLAVDKPAPSNADEDGSGDVSVGDTLTYTITATNTGTANLTDVVVTDNLITPTGGTTPCALVVPGGTCTLIGTYVVQVSDLGTNIFNTATGDSDQTDPVTDDETVPVPSPELSIDKPAPTNADNDGSGDVSVGDVLTYTITATNKIGRASCRERV